jgi:hypothetical protein
MDLTQRILALSLWKAIRSGLIRFKRQRTISENLGFKTRKLELGMVNPLDNLEHS